MADGRYDGAIQGNRTENARLNELPAWDTFRDLVVRLSEPAAIKGSLRRPGNRQGRPRHNQALVWGPGAGCPCKQRLTIDSWVPANYARLRWFESDVCGGGAAAGRGSPWWSSSQGTVSHFTRGQAMTDLLRRLVERHRSRISLSGRVAVGALVVAVVITPVVLFQPQGAGSEFRSRRGDHNDDTAADCLAVIGE